jgi:homopolymeric O-antigen transport system permease protein
MASTPLASRTSTPAGPGAIVIRPQRGWNGLSLTELWDYRELLYFLTKRELQIRYKQSVLGGAWVVLQPLGLTFILTLVFSHFANLPSDNVPFPVFALAGLTAWTFTANATSETASSLVADSNLLTKVYFPRLVIPLAKVVARLLDLCVSFAILILLALLYGFSIGPTVLLTPLFILLVVATATGAGVLFSALNVKYRDIGVVLPMLVQVWFFMTPVVYPVGLVTGPLEYAFALNPLSSAIAGVRWAFLGAGEVDLVKLAISTTSAVVLLIVGWLYFKRSERNFADLV